MKNFNFIAFGAALGLVYVSASGMIKNPVVQTAVLAVGAVGVANQLPFTSSVVNGRSPLPAKQA